MSGISPAAFDAVLFDLDGTLVDTAPDMVAVLMDLQLAEGVPPVAYDLARAHVSNGANGLLTLAFPDIDERGLERLREIYLQRYAASVCVYSTLFAGLDSLLDAFDRAGSPWGIVTNKPANLTMALLDRLQLADRAACAVSGDTLPERKPHPAPLLLACEQAGVAPERTIYVGDAARDIDAGRAAGMQTVAVAYGYITPDDDPARWDADHIVADTSELSQLLRKAVNLDA